MHGMMLGRSSVASVRGERASLLRRHTQRACAAGWRPLAGARHSAMLCEAVLGRHPPKRHQSAFSRQGCRVGRSVKVYAMATEEEEREPTIDELLSNFQPPPTRVTATGRIVSIGDLHGDLVQTMRVLQVAGLMAAPVLGEPAQWVGGDATLVQMGDILDRGDDEIGILRLLWQLAEGAEEAGGAVYILNGNHETLNVAGDFRYVTPAAFRESAIVALGTADFGSPGVSFTMQARARLALFSPGAPLARKLAQNPTVLLVNDTVFAHGGLLPVHVDYGLEQINEDVSRWMLGGPEPPENLVYSQDSVVWNRSYSRDHNTTREQCNACSKLRDTLDALGVKRLVVGHTPQMQGCNSECDRLVWRVDVGMSAGVMGAPVQALEIVQKPDGGSSDPNASAEERDNVEVNVLRFEANT